MPLDGTEFNEHASPALMVITHMAQLLAKPDDWTKDTFMRITPHGTAYCLAGALRQSLRDCLPSFVDRFTVESNIRRRLNRVIVARFPSPLDMTFTWLGFGLFRYAIIWNFNDTQTYDAVMTVLFAVRQQIEDDHYTTSLNMS